MLLLLIIQVKIVLIVVKKCKNLYLLEPIFVIIADIQKIEILMQQLIFCKGDSVRWGTPNLLKLGEREPLVGLEKSCSVKFCP